MKKNVKIQSISNIITNSSSEVFLLNSELSFDELYNMLKDHIEKHQYDYEADPLCIYEHKEISDDDMHKYNFHSGDGGDWSLEYNRKTAKIIPTSWYAESFEGDKGDYEIMIDHNSFATIKWIIETFDIISQNEW